MSQRHILKKLAWMVGGLGAASLGIPALALQTSTGEVGIDALRLHSPPYNLLGRKIAIGAVDIGRPRQFGLDKGTNSYREIPVMRVFFRDTPAKTNTNSDPQEASAQQHAENVAAVMVSSNKALKGVAPEARLYAAAVGFLSRSGQPEECLAAQHIAQQNGGDVRAINMSFGESLRQDPRTNAILDGNALLTQCVDWSSRVHDLLYVIAGNQGRGGIPIPTDNFNGVNVAFTTLYDGVFAKVDFANLGTTFSGYNSRLVGLESNIDNRRSLSLVAPGSNLDMLNLEGQVSRSSGTSFAAPHVTATVALLQEFGDRQLSSRQPKWTVDSRRHEVMKAVLLNSADKIKDSGDGRRLGMSRTIVKENNSDWLATVAYKDPAIPLDGEMGSGQLNAFRAYEQFSAGQWSPSAPVAPIGWDYRSVEAKGSDYQEYVLEQPLLEGSFVSITLAWDRLVELNDTNKNGQYDLDESFSDRGLNNLDVYLMPADENNTAKSVDSSVSPVDSLEHIFHQIPKTGRYKIRVQFRDRVAEPTQPYAISWWTVPAR